MKKNLILKFNVLIILLSLISGNSYPCSMYKLTLGGRTMAGNNEDSWRTDSRIWFERGTGGKLGALFVGYSGKTHPDGGMNEAGLVFDAFTMHRKANIPARDPGKKDFDYRLPKIILQQCRTVDEVSAFLSGYNLQTLNGSPIFNGGMLLFIDSTGKYLVVEADGMTLGNDPKFVLANFSLSGTRDLSTVRIARYRKGVAFRNNRIDTSLAFCTALSDTMSVTRKKAGDGTLYTTIYDLNGGLVYTYFFHDFSKCLKFNLKEELAKGDHAFMFADIFPDNKGYLKFLHYQTPRNNRAIAGFLVLSGLLFLASSAFFLAGFLRTFRRKNPSAAKRRVLLPALSLLSLLMSWYMWVLLTNQAIFFFPAPYQDDIPTLSNLTSFLPPLLLLLILPMLFLNFLVFRQNTWSRLSRVVITLNTLTFLVLLGLFGYWGLFHVFK